MTGTTSATLAAPATPPSLPESFREAFRRHPAGVAVLTADAGDRPIAITVSSLISVSADPPIVAFSLSAQSGSTQALLEAKSLVIHFLRFTDLELAKLGATRGADRFGPDVAWERLPSGEPRYRDVATWFRARIIGNLPLGTATLVAAEFLEGSHSAGTDPAKDASLVYVERCWHRLQADTAQMSAR